MLREYETCIIYYTYPADLPVWENDFIIFHFDK